MPEQQGRGEVVDLRARVDRLESELAAVRTGREHDVEDLRALRDDIRKILDTIRDVQITLATQRGHELGMTDVLHWVITGATALVSLVAATKGVWWGR